MLEVDAVSRAARIQGGALGPVLEEQLRPHGYTLRHFPQSFEFSTLGGWLATRSGGHYASVYTHIDDLVESMRMVTPGGVMESRRLPGFGSGTVTRPPRARQRRHARRHHRGVDARAGPRAVQGLRRRALRRLRGRCRRDARRRAVGLFPTNCRLLDATEAMVAAGVDDGSALLVLGFESADHPVDAWIERAVELCARPRRHDAGGRTQQRVDRDRSRRATARSARGATRSCARRTDATRSCRWP